MEGEHHIFIGSLCMGCSDLHLVTIPVYYPFLHQQGLTPAASVTFYTSVTARPPQTADQNNLVRSRRCIGCSKLGGTGASFVTSKSSYPFIF